MEPTDGNRIVDPMRDLDGLRILLTRSEDRCHLWAAEIQARGGTPLLFPCIRHETLDSPQTASRLQSALESASWLVLTSPRGAQEVSCMVPLPLPPQLAIGVVGAATADSALKLLGRVDLVPERQTGASLAGALAKRLATGGRNGADRLPGNSRLRPGREESPNVVAAAAQGGRHDLEQELKRRGVVVTRIAVYRTVSAPPLEPRHVFRSPVDVVLLASPSAVRGLVAQAQLGSETGVITIGPTTSAAAREAGFRVVAEAEQPNLDGMLEAIP